MRIDTPVPHLCPDLAAVARIVRRHVPVGHPDRADALRRLKDVRDGVHTLRENAAAWEREAKK